MEILAPINIVIVDRSGQLESFLTNHVDLPSFDFTTVSDSRSLRKALERSKPEALFFSPDFAEPSLLEFLRSFKKTPQGQHTTVILFVDRTQKELIARCFDAGLDDYVAVPFVTPELLAKVKPLVRIKALKNDLAEMKQTMGKAGNAVVNENVSMKEAAQKQRDELTQVKLTLIERDQMLALAEKDKAEMEAQLKEFAQIAAMEAEAREKIKQWETRATENEAQVVTFKEELAVEIAKQTLRITELERQANEREMALQKVTMEFSALQKVKPSLTVAAEQSENERDQVLSELEIGLRLRRYVSQTFIERILNADNDAPFGLTPIKRQATFMFIDVRDLAQFADDLEPRLIVALMNEVFGHITQIVSQYGGVVNKYLGDSLIAIFGDPIPQRDYVLKALQAALKIKHIARHDSERPGLLRSSYKVAVTVHAGTALFGNFGTQTQIDYTAVGRDMMLAARLLGHSHDQAIIVTQSTYKALRPKITIMNERAVPIKGYDEDVIIGELESIL